MELKSAVESIIPPEWERVPVGVPQREVYRLAAGGFVEYEFRSEPLVGRADHSFMWWRKAR